MSYLAEYPLGTKEYVKVTLTSDRTLGAQAVEIKVNGSWLPATWTGSPATTNVARTTSVVDFAAASRGPQHVYARFTDSPEIPIVDCGQILVTA
jgi:hypothetical protein